MISSQDGTEDRLPRAALRPCRAACSPADSVGAEGAASAGDGAEVTGAAGLAAAAGVVAVGESAALEDATAAVSSRAWATRASSTVRAVRAG